MPSRSERRGREEETPMTKEDSPNTRNRKLANSLLEWEENPGNDDASPPSFSVSTIVICEEALLPVISNNFLFHQRNQIRIVLRITRTGKTRVCLDFLEEED